MKNIFLLAALLLPSFSSIQMAWSKDYGESAEECYRIMETYVNGRMNNGQTKASGNDFFSFQDHHNMEELHYKKGATLDSDSKTAPSTQINNFDPGVEQVQMQIYEGPSLEKALKEESKNSSTQTSSSENDKIVRRYVITHVSCKALYGPDDKKLTDKCVPESFKRTIFDIQNPASRNCFKTIRSADQTTKDPSAFYSSSFCQKWNAFANGNKGSGKALYEKFKKENSGWEKEFREVTHPDNINLLKQAVYNCKRETKLEANAVWDASKAPYNPKQQNATGAGSK